jgi:bacillithiol biosynthesis cysteine-adding enzyme BshC
MVDYRLSQARTMARFPVSEVERTNRLLADYLRRVPNAMGLFAHAPEEMPAMAQRNRPQADRAQLADGLLAFQQRLGADDAALANARLLADPTTPVVTTGQQPGMLTGPLYNIYKALTVINLAGRLSADLRRPVVPVFWAGADDDDRGEVDHCGWWDGQFDLHAIHYPEAAGTPGQLVGDLPIDGNGELILAQLDPLLAGLPFAGEVRALLRETLAESVDLGEWFCRLLSRLCSSLGLVLCDARLPVVRQLAAEVLRREIQAPLHSTTQLGRQVQELQRRGYRPQLTKPPEVCNFFHLHAGRQRVSYHGERFHVGGRTLTQAELLACVERQPHAFAPNAVLRPVLQEYLLGSAAFVAGPNELGYWAELSPVFQALGVAMPPVIPRAAATLVPANIARILQQWQANPLDLYHDFDQARLALLRERQPETVSRGFARSRAGLETLVAELVPLVAGVDETLGQSALATHQRMLNELERLERKTLKAVERQATDLTERLERVRNVLFPQRGLQERTLNIFSVLARYGPNTLLSLRTLLDGEEGQHVFVEM